MAQPELMGKSLRELLMPIRFNGLHLVPPLASKSYLVTLPILK